MSKAGIADGLYRLVKHEEDHVPVFPSQETVVEVRRGVVINLSTGREWPLGALGKARSLYGPLSGPYDLAPLEKLSRICLGAQAEQSLAAGGKLPVDGS